MIGNYQITRYLSLGFVVVCMVSAVILTPALALAELPPRPTRPTPQSNSHSEALSGGEAAEPLGGYIILQMPEVTREVWTVVQWQDQAGAWHDVEGWRGRLDPDFKKTWWVHPAHFGQGPFRWAVYQGQAGPLLAISAPFYLPHHGYEVVPVAVPLEP